MVKLYSIERRIGTSTYSDNVACESWEEAERVATAIGGRVTGTDVHEVSAISAEQLMDFIGGICDEPPSWKYNAREQLEAFLSVGWPERPNQVE